MSIRLEARGCLERCSDGRRSEQEYECEIERERERERDMATSAFVVTTAVCLHVLVFVQKPVCLRTAQQTRRRVVTDLYTLCNSHMHAYTGQ